MTVEQLVGFANAFFIANALIGLFAAIKLLNNPWIKGMAMMLSVLFGILLLRSSVISLVVIFALTFLLIGWRHERHNSQEKLDI